MTVLVSVVGASVAAAHAATDRIVVEVYEGNRPADAAAVLAPVYAELAKRGYAQGPDLVSAVDRGISRDGGALSAGQVVEAQRQVDDAFQKFVDGSYPRSLDEARAALALYASAPGQLAREPALRDLRYKALIIAARSSEVNGAGEDAFAFMAEAIRSFPDRPINNAQFDPSVSALY